MFPLISSSQSNVCIRIFTQLGPCIQKYYFGKQCLSTRWMNNKHMFCVFKAKTNDDPSKKGILNSRKDKNKLHVKQNYFVLTDVFGTFPRIVMYLLAFSLATFIICFGAIFTNLFLSETVPGYSRCLESYFATSICKEIKHTRQAC